MTYILVGQAQIDFYSQLVIQSYIQNLANELKPYIEKPEFSTKSFAPALITTFQALTQCAKSFNLDEVTYQIHDISLPAITTTVREVFKSASKKDQSGWLQQAIQTIESNLPSEEDKKIIEISRKILSYIEMLDL